MEQLEEIAAEFHRARLAAELFDADWNLVWVSDELKALLGEDDETALGYGTHVLEARNNPLWSRTATEEAQVEWSRANLPFVLHETPTRCLRRSIWTSKEIRASPTGSSHVRHHPLGRIS